MRWFLLILLLVPTSAGADSTPGRAGTRDLVVGPWVMTVPASSTARLKTEGMVVVLDDPEAGRSFSFTALPTPMAPAAPHEGLAAVVEGLGIGGMRNIREMVVAGEPGLAFDAILQKLAVTFCVGWGSDSLLIASTAALPSFKAPLVSHEAACASIRSREPLDPAIPAQFGLVLSPPTPLVWLPPQDQGLQGFAVPQLGGYGFVQRIEVDPKELMPLANMKDQLLAPGADLYDLVDLGWASGWLARYPPTAEKPGSVEFVLPVGTWIWRVMLDRLHPNQADVALDWLRAALKGSTLTPPPK